MNNPARVTGIRPRTIPERRVSTINNFIVSVLVRSKNIKLFDLTVLNQTWRSGGVLSNPSSYLV